MISDLASVEGRLYRQSRASKGDKSLAGEIAALERAAAILGDGVPIYRSDLTADERAHSRAGVPAHRQARARGREHRRGPARRGRRRSRRHRARRDDVLAVCLQLEAEAAALDPEARTEMLEGLGLGDRRGAAGRPRRVPPARAAHVPHHRRHRVACVDVPCRRQGARVRGRDPLRPAARLHPGRGDRLARAARDRLVDEGARAGRLRVEGKDYVVEDGDVLEIRFNV